MTRTIPVLASQSALSSDADPICKLRSTSIPTRRGQISGNENVAGEGCLSFIWLDYLWTFLGLGAIAQQSRPMRPPPAGFDLLHGLLCGYPGTRIANSVHTRRIGTFQSFYETSSP